LPSSTPPVITTGPEPVADPVVVLATMPLALMVVPPW
jgi:hypothetical protein